ncbi:hypothetical protein LUZ61_013429 [Rhynchospora tenuis]|uniref:NB-ARC domain-containing protein n=1 Tax=Rhynchospora tenuis TaxID=198213 RepID=A0AAD5W8M8_9POAL|nr:hypothetical protein LUZ61_013429 [Rhynchospora tenuis]
MVVVSAAAGIPWAISPVIDIVNKKIESYIEKYFQNAGTGEQFKEMKKSLREIRLMMATIEKQRIEKHEEVQLVQEIKDAIYEAEDVVKEFEYKLLEKEKFMEQQKLESVAIASQPLKKQKLDTAKDWIKSTYHTLREKGKELSGNLDWPILGDGEFKKQVKEVSESLVRAKASAEILIKLMNTNTYAKIQSSNQENESDTSSQICEEIIGRIEEREKIIELLFQKNKETPTIIQIEGPGGIGKTTLGRLVYNDPRVTEPRGQGYFELKIWLSVSENFDGIKLTKEMLKYVSPDFSPSNTNFNLLQKELKEKLASKRILLVLDNVWYVKHVNKKSSFEQYWLQFLAPLKNTKLGSKIIVTTREAVVDTTLESFGSVEMIKLGGLTDADSWSLLKLKAFGRKNQNNRHNLEPIGEELVKNLKGFPLAIRVVGTELRAKSDIDEWKRILNDNALDKSDIMGILLRSYEHLPDYLQPCFSYCSLFPKGYYLKPDRLVHMWIAQGFVNPREQKTSEEIGKSYFNELLDRLKLIDTSKSITMELGGHVQLHSVWRGGPAVFEVKKKYGWELDHLRDFNNIKGSLEINGLQNVASKQEAIKAQLGSKEYVTELKLDYRDLTSIAESNIEHNEILEVLRPHPNIERLSLKIWKYPGDKFPCWLESNWLSRLTYIEIGEHPGFKMLPALGQFSQLKNVSIYYFPAVSRIGGEFYGNGIFPSLEELEIFLMDGLEEWSSPRGVCSFPKLRKMKLSGCPDLFSHPEMESFCSLESVEIKNCPKIRSLPKLPVSLRVLRVEGLHPDLKQFYGNNIFPSLEELYIEDMKGLEEWSSPRVHHDLEEQLGNKNGPEWDKVATVSEWDKVAAVSGCYCSIKRAGTRLQAHGVKSG